MKIVGIENLSTTELNFELQRGAKFVLFQYCVSLLVITLKRPTSIYFVRSGESTAAKSLPWTLLSLLVGWWGIPWGPIYTIQSVWKNSKGGVDVTADVVRSFNAAAAPAAQATGAAAASN